MTVCVESAPPSETLTESSGSWPSFPIARPQSAVSSRRPGRGLTGGRRLSFRPWPGDRPPLALLDGDPGALLTPAHERVLGRPAGRLWRHLLDLRGYAPVVLTVGVAETARGLAMRLRTCERALARLQDAGLVSRSRARCVGRGGWYSTLLVQVWGGLATVRGREEAWVPVGVTAWCEAHRAAGRPRKLWRDRAADAGSARPADAHLAANCGGVLSNIISSVCTSTTVEVRGAETSPQPLRMIDQHTVPRSRVGHAKLTPGDPGDPDDPKPTPEQLKVRLRWVHELVEAYNAATLTVTGRRGFLRLPLGEFTFTPYSPGSTGSAPQPPTPTAAGTKERWKHYARLYACAVALKEHDIPPQTWAEWELGRAKRSLHVQRVFCASQVENRAVRAIFRQESGYGHGAGSVHFAPTAQHLEQMYRIREASQRRRGIQHLRGMPKGYADLRAVEIAQGAVDPMERFPETRATAQPLDLEQPAQAALPVEPQPGPTRSEMEQMLRRREASRVRRGVPPMVGMPAWYVEMRKAEL